jgi:hypothetical protein
MIKVAELQYERLDEVESPYLFEDSEVNLCESTTSFDGTAIDSREKS